ncbi:TolC family protein [Aliarcobacter butzleri]|uniref:Transporter n=1 Tax=Aliarcobacter butzleri L351 TaxID=1447259 RepID=A0A837J3X8_9BACT|nr:TolC family protein [Aliarcobacter butzleri]KLE00029.1 transporter [Aliarcobacter butzleri L351]KLE12907.1 transporter [Aliarcobacter butzleri L350]MDN5046735.1 TolC family protein [Aliarcobacter butzleri]MDN5046794.1 TolC family protein [Aliarcobacter butzleri]MDN5058019.1 TolC family protein [Aliarcobacter butzleri]
MFKNIFIFFLISTSLYAISLKELLNNVEVTNENYQAQQALQEMSKKQYESATKDNYPTFNLIGAYENNSKVLKTEPEDIAYAELKASYILYDGERIRNNELSKKSLHESQQLKTQYLKQEIMLEVIKQYFSYQNTKSAIDVINYKINELNGQIKKFEILVKNDLETKDKLQALIASKKEALYDIETLKIDLENSILQLSLLTGFDILPQDNDKLIEPTYDEKDRFDIEAKRLEAKSVKYTSEGFNYSPTISINNSLKKQEYLHYDETYNDKFNNQIMLQINFPIFDFGKISKDKEASQLEALALNKEIAYKEKSIQIERKLALKSLESSKVKLDSAISGLEATNTTYEFSKKRFDANLISYTEYLTELTKKQDANYRVILAKNDIELKKANLAFALGIDLLTLIKE